jgi:uncharacterized RDD family membrane protein YckC
MSDFPPPPPTPGTDRLASIGQRALAQVIDTIILGIPMVILSSLVVTDLTEADGGQQLVLLSLFVGINIAYNTILVAVYGATIGKRIMKLMVVNRSDGSAVTWTYAAVRALIPSVAGLIPFVGLAASLVVYLRAIFHPLRQGLHDAAAGTIVVRR